MMVVSPEFGTVSKTGTLTLTTSPNVFYSTIVETFVAPPDAPSVGGAAIGVLALNKFRIKSRRKRRRG